jgi:hypothetical protein
MRDLCNPPYQPYPQHPQLPSTMLPDFSTPSAQFHSPERSPRKQMCEVRCRKPKAGSPKSEARSRKPEAGSPKPEARSPKPSLLPENVKICTTCASLSNFSQPPRYLFSWFGFDTTELVCANLETKQLNDGQLHDPVAPRRKLCQYATESPCSSPFPLSRF